MAQLEVENDQLGVRMKDKPWMCVDVEIEHVHLWNMIFLKLHKEFNYNNILEIWNNIIGFKIYKNIE